MTTFPLILSKSLVPCLWESGGGMTHTGGAALVTNKHGQPKSAIYIRTSGSLACLEHALIPISVGDHFIIANHHRGDFTIEIFCIKSINTTKLEAERVNLFDYDQWDTQLDPNFNAAIDAARAKATCYHCRDPHFIRSRIKEEVKV